MNIIRKIKLEFVAVPLVIKGYPHQYGRAWFEAIQRDKKTNYSEIDKGTISYWRRRGYLSSSLKRWGQDNLEKNDYISDFEYCCLSPINSDFSKWFTDTLTTQRIMRSAGKHFRNVYYSIVQRENKQLILCVGHEDHQYSVQDILDLIHEKGSVEIRPSWWNSDGERYRLTCDTSETDKEQSFLCNGETISPKEIDEIIQGLNRNYVVAEIVPTSITLGKEQFEHELKFWIANDISEEPHILAAEMTVIKQGRHEDEEEKYVESVNLDDGVFIFHGEQHFIPNWKELKTNLCRDASEIPQISFFTTTIAIALNSTYTYLCFSGAPKLPEKSFGKELNDYLKEKYSSQFQKNSAGEQLGALRRKLRTIERRTVSRKGMRPYMYGLWREAARNDIIKTKGISLPQKLWAHRHGFFSWRLYQYGLTKENYTNFLSDYDYYWLNRINNHYQIWVNDKTTFRYIMEPFKEFIPQYYFSIYKRSGETVISKMWDCPENVPRGFEGVLEMLRRKGKLAFKASSGTHGDGFYCLEYENENFYANGECFEKSELKKLIEGMKSFYVVTEYLEMHREIRKIYSKSVNTVRMMVVNDHGYDPRILQTYMRIGSGNTGYTDNVGYGGICAFVDKETGELYKPETIKDHVFYDCPIHPNTGTVIAGNIPHWDLIKTKILEISQYLSELEYLGFDIAVTEDGFKILEINIHQDLHKVACFDDEINEYFKRKIAYKYETTRKKNTPEEKHGEYSWISDKS